MHADIQLLRDYAKGCSPTAMNALVQQHGSMVYGVCLRLTRNTADAEEACQDTFLEMAKSAQHIGRNLPAWLHTVGRRHAMRAIERRKRFQQHAGEVVAEERIESSDAAELILQVDNALTELSEKLRTPLILHHLEGKTQEEIAGLLGVSQATVQRRLSTGLDLLRTHLSGLGCVTALVVLPQAVQAACTISLPQTTALGISKIALAGIAPQAATVGISAFLIKAVVVALSLGGIVGGAVFLSESEISEANKEQHKSEVAVPTDYEQALATIDVKALEQEAMTSRTPSYACRVYDLDHASLKRTGLIPGACIVNTDRGAVRSQLEYKEEPFGPYQFLHGYLDETNTWVYDELSPHPERSFIEKEKEELWYQKIEQRLQQKVSVNFENTHVVEVLHFLSKTNGISMVLQGDVEKSSLPVITFSCEGAEVARVVESISTIAGLSYDITEGGICFNRATDTGKRPQDFSPDSNRRPTISITWNPVLHYFRELPKSYHMGNWQPATQRRSDAWDAHMLLAASVCYADPQLAERAYAKAIAVGYPVDMYARFLKITIAKQLNDFETAYQELDKAQVACGGEFKNMHLPFNDVQEQLNDASGLANVLGKIRIDPTQSYYQLWLTHKKELQQTLTLQAQEMGRVHAHEAFFAKTGYKKNPFINDLRSVGCGYFWYDSTSGEMESIGTIDASDWELSLTIQVFVPHKQWVRDEKANILLQNKNGPNVLVAIEQSASGLVSIRDPGGSYTYTGGVGDTCVVRLTKIGKQLETSINGVIATRSTINDACDVPMECMLSYHQSMVCISDFSFYVLSSEPTISQQQSLSLAVQENDGVRLQAALESGHNPAEIQLDRGHTLLHSAAYGNRAQVMEVLLRDGRIDMEATNVDGCTALNRGALHYATEACQLLIEAGADVMATNRWGWLPLDYAVNTQNIELIECLLRHKEAYQQVTHREGAENQTPLERALAANAPRMVIDQLLCITYQLPLPDEGAYVGEARLEWIAKLPIEPRLHALLLHDTHAAFIEIMQHLSQKDIERLFMKSQLEPDLLHVAVNWRKHKCIRKLLQVGADCNAQHPGSEETVLLWALTRTYDPIAVDILLEHNANPWIPTRWGSDAMKEIESDDLPWARQGIEGASRRFSKPGKNVSPSVESIEDF